MKYQDRLAKSAGNDDESMTYGASFSPDTESADTDKRQSNRSPSASKASYSLGRLEQDLRTVHSKWAAVENEISQRDEQLANLQRELDAVRGERDDLIRNQRKIKVNLAAEKEAAVTDGARHAEQKAIIIEQRVQIQELQDYIDGRKDEWDSLKAQLRDYEDALNGIGSSLDAHDAVVTEKNEEKAALATRIKELEHELSELTGRHTERDAAHADLQQTLDEQSRELGSLNNETARLQSEVDELQSKLAGRDATLSELQAQLQSKKVELKDAQKFGGQTGRELLAELQETKAEVDAIRAKATEHEIRATELQAMLVDADSQRKEAEQELDAQLELVQVLERELGNERENGGLSDRSMNRLSVIHSGVRELDVRIGDDWVEPSKLSEQAEEIFESPDEVMLDPEEVFTEPDEIADHMIVTRDKRTGELERYPLFGKEVTIGRSRSCDIRIDSKYISRNHAKILIEGSRAVIEDVGSTNGFVVNSKHVTRHTLEHGDKFEIGTSKFRYLNAASD